jgi:monoamine oxidase
MARTPLLRAFRQLAKEQRAADELGVDPAEVREYSRREFLKRAGVTGAAVAVAGPVALSQRANAATAPRIAIVGGGIAGLNAALRLADKGYASTIYEASPDRVGGRMHSDTGYFANGQVAEFCGELIDTGHMTIRQLAQRFKLPTVDLLGAEPNGTEDTYWFFGGYYSKDQADKDFQPIHQTLQGQVQATSYPTTYKIHTDAGVFFDQMSVYDWIETYVAAGHRSPMGALLDAAYNIEYGAETTDQAALNLMYLLGYNASPGNFLIYGASDERFHIAGGNQQLPEAIANYLGRQTIEQGWAMRSIRANADGTVSMSFSTPDKNQTVTADHAILALPFAVLRTLDYTKAGFDSLKKTAITQLGAGRNGKLQLQFSSRCGTRRARTAISTPTSGSRAAGTSRAARPARRASSSTTRAGTSPAASRRRRPTRTRRRIRRSRRTRSPSSRASRRSSPGSRSSGTGRRRCRRRSSIHCSSWRTRTGASGSTRRSPATRASHRGTSTSPASTARRTSRVTWRAARWKAPAPRTRSSPR